MLPGRDKEQKRRSNVVLKSLNPVWNYCSVYPNVYKEELQYKTIEITVWDWDRFSSNDFLGIINLDLSDESLLDDKPRWYKLADRELDREVSVSPRPKFKSFRKQSRR